MGPAALHDALCCMALAGTRRATSEFVALRRVRLQLRRVRLQLQRVMLQLPLHCSFRYTPDSVPQYGAALKALIEETVGIAGGAPATLISHSMGGLQARLPSPGDDAGELRRRCGDDAARRRQASLATRLSQPGKGQLGAADQREPLDRSPGSPAASERRRRVSTGSTLTSTLEQAVAGS